VCWKPCSSCWSFHLLREEFLSAPIHSPPLWFAVSVLHRGTTTDNRESMVAMAVVSRKGRRGDGAPTARQGSSRRTASMTSIVGFGGGASMAPGGHGSSSCSGKFCIHPSNGAWASSAGSNTRASPAAGQEVLGELRGTVIRSAVGQARRWCRSSVVGQGHDAQVSSAAGKGSGASVGGWGC
jgi:hypothetical protein